MDVPPVLLIIIPVPDPVIRKAPFPDLHLRPRLFRETIRKSTLDKLQRSLKGEARSWSEEQVEMIRHEDEFIEQEDSFVAVAEQGIEKQFCSALGPE